jgi:light-regulated signal transduction histidine kinase (bacteriophytochrome)
MGVKASMSVSIMRGGRLWGLFACHHYSPRLPSFAHRSAAELFGQMFSLMLESRERREVADYETKARSVADRLMASVAQDGELLHDAPWLGEVIFDTVPADGVGVSLDGKVSLSGLTPSKEQFATVLSGLNRITTGQVFTSDSIGTIFPEAGVLSDRAAGILVIPVSRSPRDYVVLFRSEQLRSVRWAGNPEKPVDFGPNGARLTPRKSFEEWSQLVKGKAKPFSAAELRVAEMLRTAILEIILRLSESASEYRQRANEKQELLIAELNHRVRNILSLIRGLISQTRDHAVTTASFVETLEDRIQSLARAHDQITSDRWSPARLVDLISTEAGAYLGEKRQQVQLTGPNVLIEPGAFTTLALVVHELLTNAAKYGALSDGGLVSISWELDKDGSLNLTWQEEGGPPVTAPARRGFGSTIIERSVPYDLGGTAEISYRLGGVQACFCVPSRHIHGVLPDTASPGTPVIQTSLPDLPLKAKRVLLVEDSMIIALDAEDALRALGANDVLTASTCRRALDILAATAADFALLDFNLGSETSLLIADRLSDAEIPFVFATGYGDEIAIPDRHKSVPVIKKPYGASSLTAVIGRLEF